MENNETKSEEIIEVQGLTQKLGKNGNVYFSVKTDKGSMTVFDKPIIDELQKHIGQRIQVEVARNDRGFCNIRKYNSCINVEKVGSSQAQSSDNFADARAEKNKSMYVSYAKDLFIALIPLNQIREKPLNESEQMDLCCDLVNQSIGFFE